MISKYTSLWAFFLQLEEPGHLPAKQLWWWKEEENMVFASQGLAGEVHGLDGEEQSRKEQKRNQEDSGSPCKTPPPPGFR